MQKTSQRCESLRKLITRSFEVESRKGDRFLIIPHEVEGHVTYFLADHLRLSLLRCENSTQDERILHVLFSGSQMHIWKSSGSDDIAVLVEEVGR